jgi:Neprosin
MRRRNVPPGILPTASHLELVAATSFDYHRLDPRSRVRNEAAFETMKSHIVDFYADVPVLHSFEDSAGAVFDCIPIEQQPSLRDHEGPVSSPPDLTPVLRGGDPEEQPVEAQPATEQRDRHGNLMQAPPGTVPVRRLTLNDLARFDSLEAFFRKHPGGRGSRSGPPRRSGPVEPSAPDADPGNNHRYATTDQDVANIGGHSALCLYSPSIDANQVFSLSQQWYAGGTGAGHQTVEVGWQVYPQFYGHSSPVFFIYWTSDNYGPSGAYNLTKPGFVQYGTAAVVGMAQSPVSVQGGQQMEIDIAVYLYQGNWWIYYGGVGVNNAIGYYPTSLFGTGQMATNSDRITYGGETVCNSVSWPAMGSGAFAAAGWQQAAYHRAVFYCPTAGGAQWATLTPYQPSPACYTVNLGLAASPWGRYFFFGGPGGGDC